MTITNSPSRATGGTKKRGSFAVTIVGLAVLSGVGLTACSSVGASSSTPASSAASAASAAGSSTPASSAALKAPATVDVEATLNLVSTPLLVALGPNYLGKVATQFHTKFVYNPGTSASVQVANLLGGSDQFYTPVSAAIFPPIVAGKGVQLINQLSQNGTQIMVGAAKYKASRGSNLAAYNGGTWCYASPGSASEAGAEAAAVSAGLSWGAQKGLSLGSSSAFVPTMQSGECDISAEDSTDAAKAIAAGVGYVVQNQTIGSVSAKVYGGKAPLIGAVLATMAPFAQKYPALVQAVDTALVKAELYVAYNAASPAKIYALMPAVYQKANSETSFAAQWNLVSASFTGGSGLIEPAGVSSTVAHLKTSAGPAQATAAVVKAVQNSYTYAAYASLGLPKPASDGSALSRQTLQANAAALGL